MHRHVLFVLLSIALTAPLPCLSAVPDNIQVQALLRNAGGEPVTAAVSVEVLVWDAEEGGNMLAQEAFFDLKPDNGVVSLTLGETGPKPLSAAALAGKDDAWVQVKIQDGALLPRRPVLSVPFAWRAGAADTAATASALSCSGCVAEAALGVAIATQTELDDVAQAAATALATHAGSDDHAATYVNVTGDTINGDLTVTGTLSAPGSTQLGSAVFGPGHPYVDVTAFGAKGDSAADDTAAIQAALDAAPDSGTVLFPTPGGAYRISAPLKIDKPLTIRAAGARIKQITVATHVLVVTANDVHITGLKLIGVQYNSGGFPAAGIHAIGPLDKPLSGLRIEGNEMTNLGAYGVYGENLVDFRITGNRIHDIYYGGVMLLSARRGVVEGNHIRQVVASPNAYGIALTRHEKDTLAEAPRSTDIVVSNNTVLDIPTWEGYDTHGGARLAFVNNVARNCRTGIAIGSADNASQKPTWGPRDISVVGNVIESGVTDGSAAQGIGFTGAHDTVAKATEPATGVISGNVIKGYGTVDNSISGALYIHSTQGLVISGNTIIEPSPMGINLYHTNNGVVVTGNTITDPWNEEVEFAPAIGVRAEYNQAYIGGNTFTTDAKVAKYKLTNSIHITTGPVNNISLGLNHSNPPANPYDPAGVVTTWLQGNVGIGTPNPNSKLDVNGNVRALAFGRVHVSAVLQPGESASHNLNGLAKNNGNIGLVAVLFTGDTTSWTDNSYRLFTHAHGAPYNDFDMLTIRNGVGYSISGLAQMTFTNDTAAPARYTIKTLPLIVHSSTLTGQ